MDRMRNGENRRDFVRGIVAGGAAAFAGIVASKEMIEKPRMNKLDSGLLTPSAIDALKDEFGLTENELREVEPLLKEYIREISRMKVIERKQ